MDEKAILKSDWDYQLKIGDNQGHHTTRESEHRILLDFISRRKEGSLLVCGERGSGKTSSVFKATNEAMATNKNIKPVLIKATSIDLDLKDDLKRNVLRSLIRSLYDLVQNTPDLDEDLKTKTSELYNKAIASQVKRKNQSGNKTIREKTSLIRINPIPILLLIIAGIFFTVTPLPNTVEYGWIAPGVMIVIGSWLLWSYSQTVKKSSVDVASNYYRYDYDFSTMQSELESLLKEFVKGKFKILFIFDELDKLDKHDPFTIILNLKMLFNQGNALFIFITDPTILDKIKDKTDPSSTLFSQTLYLKRPLFVEMRSFLTEIVLDSDKLIQKTAYKNFQDFLCYQSKTSFFDLYNVLRDRIIETDPNGSVLNLNLDAEQTTKANLQKLVERIYERKKFTSIALGTKNDKILETLYNICINLAVTPKLQDITFDYSILKFPYSDVSLSEQKLYSAAIDLFAFLILHGYLRKTTEKTYQIVGDLAEIDETKGGVFVEEQRKFNEGYEKTLNLAINMANMHNQHVQGLGEIFAFSDINAKWPEFVSCLNTYFNIETFETHRKTYLDLTGTDPPVYDSETLQKMTTELQNGHMEIKNQFMNLLTNIFIKKINGLAQGPYLDNTKGGALDGSGLPDASFPHMELSFDSSGNHKLQYVLITENIPRDILDGLSHAANQNILIIYFGYSEDNSKYDGRLSILSVETLQAGLDELYRDDPSKKYLFLPITIPLQSEDLDQISYVL